MSKHRAETLDSVRETDLAQRRQMLKQQQAAMSKGHRPPPLNSLDNPREPDSTQEPIGHSGNRSGSQPASTRPSDGTQECKEVSREEDSRGVRLADSSRLELPIREYIQWAAAKNEAALDRAASRRNWRGPAFSFARYLRAHSDFKGLCGEEAAERLDELLLEMFHGVENRWEELLGHSTSLGTFGDPFDHFVECWSAVENPLGEAPLEKATRLMNESPLDLPNLQSKKWDKYKRFISLCYWLQVATQPDSIFIPVRKIGEVLNIDPKSVSNYRRKAERDGLLVKIAEHQGRKKATEFRFVLEKVRTEQASEIGDDEWAEVE